MANSKAVVGQFSPVAGNTTRRVYDISGNFKGLIIKRSEGYLVQRLDGKSRIKKTLAEAIVYTAMNAMFMKGQAVGKAIIQEQMKALLGLNKDEQS